MKYQSPTTDLILSDYSKMCNDPEPEDDHTGENLSLILDFVLPPSAYATMALREIMKCDTSVGNQIVLEDEVKKAANDESEIKKLADDTESKEEPDKASDNKRSLDLDENDETTESKKTKTESLVE